MHLRLLNQDIVVALVDKDVVWIDSGDLGINTLIRRSQIDRGLVAVIECLLLRRDLKLYLHVGCLNVQATSILLVLLIYQASIDLRLALRNDVETLLELRLVNEGDHALDVLVLTLLQVLV
jgi:hypothetical protein